MTVFQNARVYWEMYGGVEPEGNDQHVWAVDIDMDVGGWAADDYAYFQVSVYGRKNIDSPNIATLYRKPLYRPTGSIMWKPIRIRKRVEGTKVRCVVVKVELVEQTYTAPDGSEHPMNYSDQYMDADAPPWGIRIHKASIYGSKVVRKVTPNRILEDIFDNTPLSCSSPKSGFLLDQLCFTELPKDRWEAVDDVNAMLGSNYVCWSWNGNVQFSPPGSGPSYSFPYSDPGTVWNGPEESVDEIYGAVRVGYANAKGKLQEVIVKGGKGPRADFLQAPESVKSKKQAKRLGERYLRAHADPTASSGVTIYGERALTMRPGGKLNGLAVTGITLHPLDLSCDVQFGENSRKFEMFLARLADGAHMKRR